MLQSHGKQSDKPSDKDSQLAALKATALALLLRSPRLSVSQILELLDVGDAEFRQLSADNPQIADLLVQRRNGELKLDDADLKTCAGCDEWFVPYAGARHCSDECRRIEQLNKRLKS